MPSRRPLLIAGIAGFSLVEAMIGGGMVGGGMLVGSQLINLTLKSTRGAQSSGDFTILNSTVNQLVSRKEICTNVLGNQAFDPASAAAQAVVFKDPSGNNADFISTNTNPFANNVKLTQITLKKVTGSSGQYLAQLDLVGEKVGTSVGGKILRSNNFVSIQVDEATKKITGCSGGGDYVAVNDGVARGLTLQSEPTLPEHAVTKKYVDAAGGGGGSCYETNDPAGCKNPFVEQARNTRYNCKYLYTWKDGGTTVDAAMAAAAAIGDSLTPCPDGYTQKTQVTFVCCK